MNGSIKNILEVALQSQLNILSTNYQFATSVKLHENEVLSRKSYQDVTNVPVSLEDLKKLAGVISEEGDIIGLTNKSTRKMWQSSNQESLKESGFFAQIENYSETLPRLNNKMLRLMGVDPLAVKVKLTLQHVIICGTGSSVKFSFNENNGGFVKMILQIPVEGGHEGGEIKVELNDQIRLFNVCDGSDRYYHLTSFYSDCDYALEEVTFGWRLAIVFDLDLESTPFPYKLSPPADIYTFLAVNNVQKTIAQWNTTWRDHPDKLVLLLEHRYAPSELSFRHLKGRDRLLVRLLLTVDTVDMYLTQLRKSENQSPPEILSEVEDSEITDDENSEMDCILTNCLCCIERGCICSANETRERNNFQFDTPIDLEFTSLTCLDDRIIECARINVDIDKEMISFNRNLVTLDPNESLMDFDYLETEGSYFDTSVLRYVFNSRAGLVISPKNSLTLELICNFTFALDRLEANPDLRVLNKVITFCQVNPRRVWLDAKDGEERTRRLVSICVQLKAKSEGSKLLQLLSSNFPGLPIQYEGLRNKAIAIEVASLIKIVGVNSGSLDSINSLFTEHRSSEQIENFAHLVIGLFDLGLLEMARTLGNRCIHLLYFHSNNLILSLSASVIVTCTSMVFRMNKENPVTGSLIVCSLGVSLKSLSLHKLFFVIKGIETTCRSHLSNSRECRQLQQDLHRKLLSNFIPQDLAVEVMFFYLKLDDGILLKKFTQELINQSNMNAIEAIVASPDIWNRAVTTLGGKWALNSLVSTRISHLEKMHIPVFSWIQDNAVFDDDPLLRRFFHSSAVRETFRGFASHQEAETWSEELFGPDQLECGYSAKIEIIGEGSKTECVITKTRELHLYHLKLFHQSRAELLALRERRIRRLPIEECSSKVRVIRTSRNQSTPSEMSSSRVSSPVTKRIRSMTSNGIDSK